MQDRKNKPMVQNRKIKFNQFIERMTENRTLKLAKDRSPTGRRTRARPRKKRS